VKRMPGGLLLLFMVGLLGLIFLAPWFAVPVSQEQTYSQFVRAVSDGQVKSAAISGRTINAEYTDGQNYRVTMPGDGSQLQKLMLDHGVRVEFTGASGESGGVGLISWLMPLIFLGGLIWFMSTQGSGGGAGQVFSFGESRAQVFTPGEKRVTMRDVAGMPEVKEELQEVVDFLRHPDRYLELGARIPKGVLLWGPPGTGKTLLARAVAGEAGVPFYSISGSDFVEIFAGVGASRVRDLFARARRHSPCIIFVDEIDAVGRQRGAGLGGGSDEREQTLNQLLVEMDGFSTAEGIIVIAATNRLDILDQAILRPGRFDRQISVDLPDRQGRREILAVHAIGKPLADDADLDHVAGMTVGFTGADLANLLNEGALLSARQCKRAIGLEELRQAFERIIAGGPARRPGMAHDERLRVAFHEAGHATVSRYLPGSDKIEKVTIVPRGRALGYVMYNRGEDKHFHGREELAERIASLLGGRAAEEIVLGEVSTGAADDLERATAIARRMVTELGMYPEIGPVSLSGGPGVSLLLGPAGEKPISDRTALAVDEAVRTLVLDAYTRAKELLRANREQLDRIAYALMEYESLEGEQLRELLA
jgi:cell division protease FtsH